MPKVVLHSGFRLSNYTLGGGSNIFYFHPYLGKRSNLTNIFQMGWNHQLVHDCEGRHSLPLLSTVFFLMFWQDPRLTNVTIEHLPWSIGKLLWYYLQIVDIPSKWSYMKGSTVPFCSMKLPFGELQVICKHTRFSHLNINSLNSCFYKSGLLVGCYSC